MAKMLKGTKEDLEKKFGKMDDEIYSSIIESVQNDMQMVIQNGGIPSESNYNHVLGTNTEFLIRNYCFECERV